MLTLRTVVVGAGITAIYNGLVIRIQGNIASDSDLPAKNFVLH